MAQNFFAKFILTLLSHKTIQQIICHLVASVAITCWICLVECTNKKFWKSASLMKVWQKLGCLGTTLYVVNCFVRIFDSYYLWLELSLFLSLLCLIVKGTKYSMTQLRSVTCHMRSHSVTCYPTQVNTPRLNPSHTLFTYPGGMEGWVDLVDLIAPQPGVEPATFRSPVQCSTTAPPRLADLVMYL